MQIVDKSNIKEVNEFVINNLQRSGFIYGNLNDIRSVSYILKRDGQIVSMANVLNDKYCTYLFPVGTSPEDVEYTIMQMKDKEHTNGTVIGEYYDILSKYYSLPQNAINEVASLSVKDLTNFLVDEEYKVDYITGEDVDDYKQAIDTISEFPNRSYELIEEAFSCSKVVCLKKENKIVSSASLTAISDKTAVITSVFTIKSEENKGYAKSCIRKLICEYGKERMILIFFSNPIAKQMYLDLGFEVKDKLIMFNK